MSCRVQLPVAVPELHMLLGIGVAGLEVPARDRKVGKERQLDPPRPYPVQRDNLCRGRAGRLARFIGREAEVDDFLNQGLTPEKAAENARIEILSWKYLFRVRKSEFADQLAQIEKVSAGCDFSRLLTPKVEVVEGESVKIKIYFRKKVFQIQVPKGYQIRPENLERMSKTLEEFYFDNLDDFADRTLKATMTVNRLETLPRYDLWFE